MDVTGFAGVAVGQQPVGVVDEDHILVLRRANPSKVIATSPSRRGLEWRSHGDMDRAPRLLVFDGAIDGIAPPGAVGFRRYGMIALRHEPTRPHDPAAWANQTRIVSIGLMDSARYRGCGIIAPNSGKFVTTASNV